MAAARGFPGSGPARDYIVHCHRCPGRTMAELRDGTPNPAEHRRSSSRLIGSREYGALWHCATHAADCPTCPRGEWTDPHPDDPGPYTETDRHRQTRPGRVCEAGGCGRSFEPSDPRQRFCSPRCANRVRQATFRRRRADARGAR